MTTGNFPSQTQGACGTGGTFPLLPPWETKGSYFKILSPFQHVGRTRGSRGFPKAQDKDTQSKELDAAQAQGQQWEKQTGVALRTPRDKMTG